MPAKRCKRRKVSPPTAPPTAPERRLHRPSAARPCGATAPQLLSASRGRAARAAGVKPLRQQREPEPGSWLRAGLQEGSRPALRADLQKRLQEDPSLSPQRFPNADRAFGDEA
ncbi:unnamed protein product [Lepidochelys kempii]